MPTKQTKSDDRMTKQLVVDETFVDPLWSKNVEVPLLEMCCACNMPEHPVILMPELRLRSLLHNLAECLPNKSKIMIVDNSNARFESLRNSINSPNINLYFSTQEMGGLNYADNSFHFALTELGLTSTCRMDVNFASYKRVLKPGSPLIWCAPQTGSFPAFFDILEECLYAIESKDAREIMKNVKNAMEPQQTQDLLSILGYTYKGGETVEFKIMFPNAEQMLLSTLAEVHYLNYCLDLNYPNINGKKLLTAIIQSFNQYFQDESIDIPMKIGIHSAVKN